MIKIDKGIPLKSSNKVPKGTYPFDHMEVGDSFFVATSLRTVAGSHGRLKKKWPDRRYQMRTVTENGTTGCRVWRTT